MNILYTRLFNLSLNHAFYKNGLPKGLGLRPTQETEDLMKGGRMLFKQVTKGVTALYRTHDDEITPLVDLGKDVRLIFELDIKDRNEFMNITDLDESISKKYASSNVLYFKNDPANASTDKNTPEVLDFELIDFISPSLFTYDFGIGTSPAQVLFRMQDENGALVSVGKEVDGTPFNTTLTIDKNDNDTYNQQVDLRDKPKGKYTLVIRNQADTLDLITKVVYVDDNFAGKDISGIVDITYNTSEGHMYGDTEEYVIEFASKETVWKYLIVNKSNVFNLGVDTISLQDISGASGPYVANTFAVSGAIPNADVRVNDLDTVIFKSNIEIPFYEVPKTLQLKKNALVKPVISHLPNPSYSGVVKEESGQLESEIYVFV